MSTLQQVEEEIENIKARNRRVETEKAWETSWTRIFMIATLTYIVVAVFFVFAKSADPFGDAIVPSIAFVLSSASGHYIKRWWLKYIHKNS